MKMNVKEVTKLGMVAAIYVAGAYLQSMLFLGTAHGQIQFRLSEMLVLLCLYHKKYAWSIIIGAFVAAMLGGLGVWDMTLGTTHSIISVWLIIKVSELNLKENTKLWLASLMVLPACFLIGIVLNQTVGVPILLTTILVMIGQFVVVTLIGVPVFKALTKNEAFMEKIQL